MKYHIISLLLGIALLFSGCQLVQSEYISVVPHTESYSQPAEEEAVTVSNYTELKNAISSFVEEGVEETVLTANAYTGNIDEDIEKVHNYITETNLKGAYLVKDIESGIVHAGSHFRLNLKINYRRTLMRDRR